MAIKEVSVRFATLADLDFLCQYQYPSTEILKRKIAWGEIVVAEHKGRPVGQVRIEYLWSAVPYIALISVLPECRRQGVGKALLGYIEEFLRESGHDVLYSSSQVDEPEPQIWHRHVGFEECGIISGINKGAVGEVFFRKQLR